MMSLDRPDVAIDDIPLPGMDGGELILQCSKIMPELQYVVYTGSVDFTAHNELVALGVTNQTTIMRKPVLNMGRFVISINHLLGHV